VWSQSCCERRRPLKWGLHAGYLHQGYAVVILLVAGVNYMTADAVAGKTYG